MCVSFKFKKWFNHKVIFLQIRDLIPVLFVLGIMLSLGTIWRSHHLNLLILFYHCKSLKWSSLLVSYCFDALLTIISLAMSEACLVWRSILLGHSLLSSLFIFLLLSYAFAWGQAKIWVWGNLISAFHIYIILAYKFTISWVLATNSCYEI